MKSRFSRIIKRATRLNEDARIAQNSKSYLRVVGLLSGLGFLIAPSVKQAATLKVDVEEAIFVGKAIEPRVLEVLPAAILSFPRSFLHFERAPENFKEILRALKSGKNGPDFEGIGFMKFLEAANRPIKNGKRKTINERRILKTFRLSPMSIKLLKENSTQLKINQTAYLESLIAKANASD